MLVKKAGRVLARAVQLANALHWRAIAARKQNARRVQRRADAFPAGRSRAPVFLFLAPEAGLQPFFASHVLLARVIKDAGHPVLLLSCDGIQPICSVKFAMRTPATASGDRGNVACKQCRVVASSVGDDYGLPDMSIESLLSADDHKVIERIVAASPDFWNVVYDGVEFGAASLGETLRHCRKTSIDELTDDDKRLLHALLFSSMAIYLAIRTIERRFEIAHIFYFGDYAYWLPPQILARRQGIPVTHISHAYNRDIDRRILSIRPGNAIAHMLDQQDKWGRYRDRILRPQVVSDIIDGTLYRLEGHGGISTYSPNWISDSGELLRELKLVPGKKTLVAYTSSTDELVCTQAFMRILGNEYGHNRVPFADQSAWLAALIAWVKERSDLQLIIRLHPRIGHNHRQAGRASQYDRSLAELSSVPANVAVVWPESPLSSYNIAELADVALIAWSSIGTELARFGIPVVAAFPRVSPFPVNGFIKFDEVPEGYFRAIECALNQAASFEDFVEAVRWTHFIHWSPMIDVSDVTPTPDYDRVPPYREPRERETIIKTIVEGEDLVQINMGKLPEGKAAASEERAAMICAIESMIVFFMTGRRTTSSPPLRLSPTLPDPSAWAGEASAGIAIAEGNVVVLSSEGRSIRRSSVLVARLVSLLLQQQRAMAA